MDGNYPFFKSPDDKGFNKGFKKASDDDNNLNDIRSAENDAVQPEDDAGDDRVGKGYTNDDIQDSSDDDLSEDEDTGTDDDGDDTVGKGYKPGSEKDLKGKTGRKGKKKLKKKRRNKVVAAFAALLIGAMGFLGFGQLSNLKLDTIAKTLKSHYSATTNDSIGTELQNAQKDYLQTVSKQCGTTISKNCNVAFNGSNPIVNEFRAWHLNRIESKLPYEITYDTKGLGSYRIKLVTDPGKGDLIGDAGKIDSKLWDKALNKTELRVAVNNSLQDLTLWDKLLTRRKVYNFLAQKYGVPRCTFFCSYKDAMAAAPDKAIYASSAMLARIAEKKSVATGAVLACLLNGKCQDKSPGTTCAKSECDELNGEVQKEADASVEQAIGTVSAGFESETAEKLIKRISDAREAGGFTRYALQQAINKVFGKEAASKLIPGIGYLQLISQSFQIIGKFSHGAQEIKKLGYLVNSQAAISMFGLVQNYADETHTGYSNGQELASMNHMFDAGNQCQTAVTPICDPQFGGLAGAEDTPMYNYIVYGKTGGVPTAPSTAGSSLFGQAFADATNSGAAGTQSYICKNNQPVPYIKLACDEEVFGGTNQTIKDISNTFDSLGLSTVAKLYNNSPLPGISNFAGDITSWATGPAASAAQGVAEHIPGVSQLLSAATSEGTKFLQFAGESMINDPMGGNPGGGRVYQMAAAGADAAYNNYAQTGLGAQQISPKQLADIQNHQQTLAHEQFASLPLWSRLFSTDSQYSLLSRLALAVPLNWRTTFADSIIRFIGNPLVMLGHQFASLVTGIGHADNIPIEDPFGQPQFGYVTVPEHPSDYWDQHCSNNPAQAYQNDAEYKAAGGGTGWNGSTTDDPVSGMPVHTTSNPCLLIEATAGAGGGVFDQSLLRPSEIEDLTGGGQ